MIPACIYPLFTALRRRGFELTLEDVEAVRLALRAGFGWESRDALGTLLAALWAKTRQEQMLLEELFAQLAPVDVLAFWQMTPVAAVPVAPRTREVTTSELSAKVAATAIQGTQRTTPRPATSQAEPAPPRTTHVQARKPSGSDRDAIPLNTALLSQHPLLLMPQFPLNSREVAQAWRRLRRPVREGPRVELDINATITQRSRLGLATPAVLVPRRRNTTRLLLLVDREGSMTPFHSFVAQVCEATYHSGRLEQVQTYYFHDQPATGADRAMLDRLAPGPRPTLDILLPELPPLAHGIIYTDAGLDSSWPVEEVLARLTSRTAVVVCSDAGAARGQYDLERVLDTVAFLKALRLHTPYVVWLNPLPSPYWTGSTAAQLARHVPMFPLDRAGMHLAVQVLRGGQYALERAV
jgi:uncharacterized protein with von Willebrand factor type A (vWA) domain